jgi:formylglycine-generating enzyme required for sulfatase activity
MPKFFPRRPDNHSSNKAPLIAAGAVILAALIGGAVALFPIIFKPPIIDFELNSAHFRQDSFIKIMIKGQPSLEGEDLVALLDSCSIDYCLEKKENHWQFCPKKCHLPGELIRDGQHILSLRITETETVRKFKIYFDSQAPPLVLEKTVVSDSTATFRGLTTDAGDTLNVDIFLWNGDRYERTQLPVTRHKNHSGQSIWAFQANVKRIPKLDENDPNFSEIFCRIQVSDQAKNIAAYELPYSHVFAKGFSRTLVGDTEILLGRLPEQRPEWQPQTIPLEIKAPQMVKTSETDEFTLVIQVFTAHYAEIAVKNLPPDASGKISYFKNNQLLEQTDRTQISDRDVAAGDLYQYFATVKGQDQQEHKTNTAFSFDFEMVAIPGGRFLMGGNEEEDEQPVHEVAIRPFFMSKFEITQKQWQAVMGNNPSVFQGEYLPVEQVSWLDCQQFIQRLNQISGKNYRLPTEAEWEYACRAGTTTPFNTGENLTTDQANYDGNYPYKNFPQGKYLEKTTPVGSYPPNAWGLYDLHGNVWEWCQDWYDANYYEFCKQQGVVENPTGPETGLGRVLRGGSWGYRAQGCRSAHRDWNGPGLRSGSLGFRLVFVP